ncbi:Phospholipase/Carboxylesterase-domain-containing protein [Crucibulum laeve]|uniref:Acyl-protein thioesterase 1 n=1 Tax=Crucibulum laeve TaxID=68775 RepID=A0A5C3LUR5_9AGAR|nr:Phospholipase/Carboxylesterase-domain-containing protein [Crucibulum laeve]
MGFISPASLPTGSSSVIYESLFTIEPKQKHTTTVIWFHGLGDSGHGILTAAQQISKVACFAGVKFILPIAPAMFVTGIERVMPSWFDCCSFNIPNRHEDEKGLYRAAKWFNDLITKENEETNIPFDRIIVGGLSQGGAVALLIGLTTTRSLAGSFALSTYIPLRKKCQRYLKSALASEIPLFWAHGQVDLQVEYGFSVNSARTLAAQLGAPFRSIAADQRLDPVELARRGSLKGTIFCSYEKMSHTIFMNELFNLSVWISVLLNLLIEF